MTFSEYKKEVTDKIVELDKCATESNLTGVIIFWGLPSEVLETSTVYFSEDFDAGELF